MHALVPHPDAPHPAVRICARLAISRSHMFSIEFVVSGAIDSINLPRGGPSARADGLWERTCFEAFVGENHDSGYVELNFAPSRLWAAYRFDDYRQGMQQLTPVDTPDIRIKQGEGDAFSISADFALPDPGMSGPLRIGLSAVIEAHDGTKSYWALHHPPGKPDFHHRDCFAIVLQPPA